MFKNVGDFKAITQALSYEFKDRKLLLRALTRRSAINERLQTSTIGDNQRLEFLGDKILNLVVSDIVMENHPDWSEGKLTTTVSQYVNNNGPLAKIAKHLGLDKYLLMGVGEEKENHARENTKVLSDAMEALIGALWLDNNKDYNFIRNFLEKKFRLLGLYDYNKAYEEAVVKVAAMTLANDLMESIMPEVYQAEGGIGMSLEELMQYTAAKKKATKPLSGFAASLEKFLASDEEDKPATKKDEPESPETEPEDSEDDTEKSTKNTHAALRK